MRINLKIKLAKILTLIGLVALIPSVNAQYLNLNEFEVKPALSATNKNKDWFVKSLKPGTNVSEQIQISNLSNNSKSFSIYVSDILKDDKRQFLVKTQTENSKNLNAWVKLSSGNINLGPNESKLLNVDFKIPSRTKLGLQKGAIIVSENSSSESSENIKIEKGIRIYLNINSTILERLNQNFIPLLIIFALMGSLILLKANQKALTKYLKNSKPLIIKNAVFIIILIIISVTSFGINEKLLKTQIIDDENLATNSYILNVKWGNFRDLIFPTNYTKNWDAQITVKGANVFIKELQNFKENDRAEIINNTSVKLNLHTGPDNDGIILKIESDSNQMPIVVYENFSNKEITEFEINDLVNSEVLVPDGIFTTYFQGEVEGAEKFSSEIPEIIAELDASAENKITAPELENLFEELPPTAEVLSNTILSSNYIKNITEDEDSKKFGTDSILIQALISNPEIIQQIGLSSNIIEELDASAEVTEEIKKPDTNFAFIPSEKINFPDQEFSFSEQKTAIKELGTIIFVQNKDTPWNTYISTSNFISLSGKGIIPSSALTIDPGETAILIEKGSSEIQSGTKRNIESIADKAILVTITPYQGSETVFTLRPKLELRIPPGTFPGRYRGSLTITSL